MQCILGIWLTWPTIFVLPTRRTVRLPRNGEVFLEILKWFRHGTSVNHETVHKNTSKNHFLSCCLYGRSYGNSSLCGAGMCMSTLVPCDWTNLNPLNAAMCIQGTENLKVRHFYSWHFITDWKSFEVLQGDSSLWDLIFSTFIIFVENL